MPWHDNALESLLAASTAQLLACRCDITATAYVLYGEVHAHNCELLAMQLKNQSAMFAEC